MHDHDGAADENSRSSSIPLDLEGFLLDLVRALSGTLEQVVGLEEASGFVSVVGHEIGSNLDAKYRAAYGSARLNRKQVTETLIDLKRRINGDFFIVEEQEEKIVFGNRACPFGCMVKGHPSLCMMTSNVFGHITSENLGYAKIVLEKTIAGGDAGCRVVVHTSPTAEANAAEGREYFRP